MSVVHIYILFSPAFIHNTLDAIFLFSAPLFTQSYALSGLAGVTGAEKYILFQVSGVFPAITVNPANAHPIIGLHCGILLGVASVIVH